MRISWQTIQQEALDRLRALIRLDTSNPPGNERIAVDYLAEVLGAHGIDSVIREGASRPGPIWLPAIPAPIPPPALCCSRRIPTSFRSSDPDGPTTRSAAKSRKDAYGAAARST